MKGFSLISVSQVFFSLCFLNFLILQIAHEGPGLRGQNQQSEAVWVLFAKTQEGLALTGASSSTTVLVTKHKQFPWGSFEGGGEGAGANGFSSNRTESKIQMKSIKSTNKVIFTELAQQRGEVIFKMPHKKLGNISNWTHQTTQRHFGILRLERRAKGYYI